MKKLITGNKINPLEFLFLDNILGFDKIFLVIQRIRESLLKEQNEEITTILNNIEEKLTLIIIKREKYNFCGDINKILNYLNNNKNINVKKSISEIESFRDKYLRHRDYIKVLYYYFNNNDFNIEDTKYLESFEKIALIFIKEIDDSDSIGYNVFLKAVDVYKRILKIDKENIIGNILKEKCLLFDIDIKENNIKHESNYELIEGIKNYDELNAFIQKNDNILSNKELMYLIANKSLEFSFNNKPRINKSFKRFIKKLSEIEDLDINLLLKVLEKYHPKSIMYKKILSSFSREYTG